MRAALVCLVVMAAGCGGGHSEPKKSLGPAQYALKDVCEHGGENRLWRVTMVPAPDTRTATSVWSGLADHGAFPFPGDMLVKSVRDNQTLVVDLPPRGATQLDLFIATLDETLQTDTDDAGHTNDHHVESTTTITEPPQCM